MNLVKNTDKRSKQRQWQKRRDALSLISIWKEDDVLGCDILEKCGICEDDNARLFLVVNNEKEISQMFIGLDRMMIMLKSTNLGMGLLCTLACYYVFHSTIPLEFRRILCLMQEFVIKVKPEFLICDRLHAKECKEALAKAATKPAPAL